MLLVIIYNSYHQLLAMFLWFVLRVAKAPETNEPDLVEDLGQKRGRFCVCINAPIPFSWESGSQLTNRFLKTEASLIKVAKAPKTDEPDLVEDLGQKKEGFACVSVLRYPSAGKVGINLSIASLRLWPP